MRTYKHLMIAWYLVLGPCTILAWGQPLNKNYKFPNKLEKESTTTFTKIRGVELSVILPAKSIAGNSLNVVLTVTNQGKEDVRFLIGHSRELNLRVLHAKGTEVGLTRYGEWAIGKESESRPDGRRVTTLVSPGKSYSETVNLARFFDLTISGDYTLSLRRDVVEYSKSGSVLPLEIKNISFKVVDPK